MNQAGPGKKPHMRLEFRPDHSASRHLKKAQATRQEMIVATEHPRLKLGKRAAFVKTRLKQLSQEPETWEADFRTLPKKRGQKDTHYLGVVVALPKGDPLAFLPMEYTPNVNDLADLLADAMHRHLTGSARRPEQIHFRDNPRWEELFRHLNDIGIETSIHRELPLVVEVYEEFLRQMRKAGPHPIIMLAPARPHSDATYPAVTQWVNGGYGHIEIGDQDGFGLIARALDYGGLVFEDEKPTTLAESLASLEKAISEWFKKQGIKVEATNHRQE